MYPNVANFAALPDATLNTDKLYVVTTTTGRVNPFTTTRWSGLYKSDGTNWIFSGIDIPAIQQLIDNLSGTLSAVATSGDYNDLINKPGLSWEFLVTNWDTAPTLSKVVTGGEVYSYTHNSVTRYRFVGTTYDSTQDCFYDNFNPITDVLSGPVICRGI
jgi:hypothetical protein